MYFIYGEEQFLIENKINEIINNNPKAKVVTYDSDVKLNQTIGEISSFSLFDDVKIVIFKNHPFTMNENIKNDDINILIKTFQLIPDGVIVIFANDSLIKNTINPFVNFLLNNAECFKFEKINANEINEYTKKIISSKNGTISDINLYYFLTKVPHKLIIINNEIEKLILFDKNITKENIDKLVSKYDLSGIYDFINAFSDYDLDKLFQSYYEKINQGETIINLISQITRTLEMCILVHSLKSQGLNNDAISKKLNKHIFVIKKSDDLLKKVSYSKIKYYLDKLAKLDVKIKNRKIDDKIGFERFLLEIAR